MFDSDVTRHFHDLQICVAVLRDVTALACPRSIIWPTPCHRIYRVGALKALEFDLARRPEPDTGQAVDGIVNRLADQDLPAASKPSHPRRHGDVAPEQIVAASDRRSHVHAHSHPDLIPPLWVVAKRL